MNDNDELISLKEEEGDDDHEGSYSSVYAQSALTINDDDDDDENRDLESILFVDCSIDGDDEAAEPQVQQHSPQSSTNSTLNNAQAPTAPTSTTTSMSNINAITTSQSSIKYRTIKPAQRAQPSTSSFTQRFRSFSNDLIRSIELAHDYADLHNSNFATATVAAAKTAAANAAAVDIEQQQSQDDQRSSQVINEQPSPIMEIREEEDDSQAAIGDNVLINSLNGVGDDSNVKEQQQHQHSTDEPNGTTKDEVDFRISSKFKPTSQTNIHNGHIGGSSRCVNATTTTATAPDSDGNGGKTVCVIPDGIHISIWEVFIYLWGVIAFFIDIVSDIILSIGYYGIEKKWLAFLTLLFVIVPNVTLSLFSLSWYIDNYTSRSGDSGSDRTAAAATVNRLKSTTTLTTTTTTTTTTTSTTTSTNLKKEKKTNNFSFDSIAFWITTILFLIFQLDLVYKHIQGFIYTLKGWVYRRFYQNKVWEKYYIEKQIKCDTDIGMLRLIDVFMDSGPQVLLQLYVITTQQLAENSEASKNGEKELIISTNEIIKFTQETWTLSTLLLRENRIVLKQIISIVSSLFSMAYALAGYHRCLRNQQFIFSVNYHKPLLKPISWWATIMQFFWYLFLITPRVLAMALFASTFRSWFFMAIFVHWLIMYSWILNFKTNYCITSPNTYNAREEIFEKFYNFVCSFIYIFAYFNLKLGRTRYRYLIYYIIYYSENCLFSITYFIYTTEKNFNFKLYSLLIILIGFWFAILFQIIYYIYFHPSLEWRLFSHDDKRNRSKQQQQTNSHHPHHQNSNGTCSDARQQTKSLLAPHKNDNSNYANVNDDDDIVSSISSTSYYSVKPQANNRKPSSVYNSINSINQDKSIEIPETAKPNQFNQIKSKETFI